MYNLNHRFLISYDFELSSCTIIYFYLINSASSSTVTSLIHAFICSIIDFYNSLRIGLSKILLGSIQFVLRVAARLITCSFTHSFGKFI